MKVNGKYYPLWQQFVDNKNQWIGGTLIDQEGEPNAVTTITDVTLEPNGEESAFFSIVGEDFTCGFDVRYGGVGGRDDLSESAVKPINFRSSFGGNFLIFAK